MTTYTLKAPTQDDVQALAAECARLRLATAHIAVHGKAILEAVEAGGLVVASSGFPQYQANHAITALADSVARATIGDWTPISREMVDQAWDRHAKRPLWGEEYMTRERYQGALNDLLWHPERQFGVTPTLPVPGTVGLAGEV